MPGGQVKTAAGLDIQEDQRHQHQQRAEQCVEEKLESCVNLVGAAPDADDEVHRDQGGFKEHEEQQAVERGKHADHQPAQNHEGAHVLVDTARDGFPAGNHDDDVDESRQQHEPQRNAVQPEVVVDIQACDPGRVLNELHRRGAELKACVQRQGHEETDDCADQRQPAHCAGLLVTTQRQQHDSEKDRRPDRQAQQTHFLFFLLVCYFLSQTKYVMSTKMPRIMPKA